MRLLSITILIAFATYSIQADPASDEPTTLISDEFGGDSFCFLIIGGLEGFPEPVYHKKLHNKFAELLARQANEHGCKFVVDLGDNVYYLGTNAPHEDWKDAFDDVYSDPSLYIPWYPTTGNHDWIEGVQPLIEYSKSSTRWVFPWYWYTLDHTLEQHGVKIRIVMFETTIPCGIGLKPDGIPLDEAMAEEEWEWLERQLIKGQDADYLIVVGHYPIFSAATAGSKTPCLLKRIQPLLQKYRVQAYISGHDSGVQHLKARGSDVQHIIIGRSSSPVWFENEDRNFFEIEKTWAPSTDLPTAGCFARVDVTTRSTVITIMDGDVGDTVLTITMPRRDKTIL